MSNFETVQELYRAFREKDYDAFLHICTDDLEWIQNKGFPDGTTRKGVTEVIEGVFKANDSKWEGFAYQIEQFLDAGDSIVVLGQYVGHHRVSSKLMSASAAHIYDLRAGKICRFRMYADTKTIWDAIIS
ncbi:nuclear transport factor 2 family protein [Leptolyngbya sp. FACHB-261]|uniref:nuclear transport factor 2 family protein n=1 Tax=Leptolyngbya sp. FACHB-261 TaxID=2692806 RepID=UPI0016876D9D|nr:nuclear transport factor 2 family protein [Leptolyngbya sp. FACHB-261]MBD2104103.1 nuclear transport factor 2 family protein [Leptolyngbya sp. FACHB-261]